MRKNQSPPPSVPTRATPRPEPTGYLPTEDEFAAWCEHPVTRFVATAYANAAQAQQDEWLKVSWSNQELDPMAHKELRTRADAYEAFLETGLSEYVGFAQRT